MPRRGTKGAESSFTPQNLPSSSGQFPMMATSYGNKLTDVYHRPSSAKSTDAGSGLSNNTLAPKKRKRDEASDPLAASKRASLAGGTSLGANGTQDASDSYPTATSDSAPGRAESQDDLSTAAAALTRHYSTNNADASQGGYPTSGDGVGGGSGAHDSHDDDDADSPDAAAAATMRGLLGEDTDYSLAGSVANGAPMLAADGDQQPYLTWKGEMSVQRADDGTVVNVPTGMVMGPNGFPIRPPVGSEIWHKFRKDNHKEVERRRRETINEGINELAKIVPGCEKNKGSILARAVQYIGDLKARDARGDQRRGFETQVLEQAVTQQEAVVEQQRALVESLRVEIAQLRGDLGATQQERDRLLDEVEGLRREKSASAGAAEGDAEAEAEDSGDAEASS